MPSKKMKCINCGKDCRPKVFINEPRCRTCYNEIKNKRKIPRKDYARNWSLKKKYNISIEEFDLLWIVFKGRCGICNNELKLPLNKRGQPLDVVAVDHDHKTGNLRGLLCNACNKGIGLFKDNPDLLLKAKEYLSGT